MKYPYIVYYASSSKSHYWVAKSTTLKGCLGQGNTQEEAVDELMKNESAWLETATELKIAIPEIPQISEDDFSGKITLRFSPSEHRLASMLAKLEGISLNQYISDAVVSRNAFILGQKSE